MRPMFSNSIAKKKGKLYSIHWANITTSIQFYVVTHFIEDETVTKFVQTSR